MAKMSQRDTLVEDLFNYSTMLNDGGGFREFSPLDLVMKFSLCGQGCCMAMNELEAE